MTKNNEMNDKELSKIYHHSKKKLRGRPSYPLYIHGLWTHIINFGKSSVKTFLALLICIIIFVAGIGSGVIFGYIKSTTPIPSELFSEGTETSYIYDRNGKVISKLTGAFNIDRKYISLSEVKDTHIADAFIAIEDERFESHIGIDVKRIGSAVVSALLNAGTPTHGGSTITQQVAKLITVTTGGQINAKSKNGIGRLTLMTS